jgi:hypothetical protein
MAYRLVRREAEVGLLSRVIFRKLLDISNRMLSQTPHHLEWRERCHIPDKFRTPIATFGQLLSDLHSRFPTLNSWRFTLEEAALTTDATKPTGISFRRGFTLLRLGTESRHGVTTSALESTSPASPLLP